MRRTACLFLLVLLITPPADAQLLTFDEPESLRLMNIRADWTPAAEYHTPDLSTWTGPALTLTAQGDYREPHRSPSFRLRSRWGWQSPAEYWNIGGSLLQMDSTVLRIDLAQPSDYFGFGAALNATVLPGRMTIELLDAGGVCLATRTLDLLKTNANAEGRFLITGTPGIKTVVIRNLGAPEAPESLFGWVIDNLAYARPAGGQGPAGPPGPKGEPGEPAAFPAGMVMFLVEGSPAPEGFRLVGHVQSMVRPAPGAGSVRVTYAVYVKR